MNGVATATDGRSTANHMAKNKVTHPGGRNKHTPTPKVAELILETKWETVELLDFSSRFTKLQRNIRAKSCEILPHLKWLSLSGINRSRERSIYIISPINLKLSTLTVLDV